MADLSGYRPTVGALDYVSRLEALITVLDGFLDEIEAGRDGEGTLLAAMQARLKVSGALSANLNFGGYRGTGAADPVDPQDLCTRAFAEALAISAVLPGMDAAKAGFALGTDGASAAWATRAAHYLALASHYT